MLCNGAEVVYATGEEDSTSVMWDQVTDEPLTKGWYWLKYSSEGILISGPIGPFPDYSDACEDSINTQPFYS